MYLIELSLSFENFLFASNGTYFVLYHGYPLWVLKKWITGMH